ncbi:MAG: tyrosine-type recombinase/integrase [Candidatus Hydrogenedentes bacterium]|nr:tyrosine-type recombinase/integrase [Candidatus Hydrogenedentota bacterium]
MSKTKEIIPAAAAATTLSLSAEEFHRLKKVPDAVEWLENLANARTRRVYEKHVSEFARLLALEHPDQFREVTRAHVIAYRKRMEALGNAPATIRAKLSALSSLFDYLCEQNSITHNPVKGVKRPRANNNEGKTPAISDGQARRLLHAPSADTLKGKRDRAMVATFLYQMLRREELCTLRVGDLHQRRGTPYLRVHGKGGRLRNIVAHPVVVERIYEYLEEAGHGSEKKGPLFRPVKNNVTGRLDKGLHPDSVDGILRPYAATAGIDLDAFSAHALRATGATNALEHQADIAKVQEDLGHANVSTTRLYDRRKSRPEDAATLKISY